MTREIGGAGITGVRSPIAGYPTDGMTPTRLANLLRAAAQGDPLEYFEMAELIEERDLHYAGVLATRKRSVTQIDITVEPHRTMPRTCAAQTWCASGLRATSWPTKCSICSMRSARACRSRKSSGTHLKASGIRSAWNGAIRAGSPSTKPP
jgi:hypothetical protein